jgi:hypothetical protein
MKEMDELEIKSEIDEISKKIDQIILTIEQADPTTTDPDFKTGINRPAAEGQWL